jgi:hypothetical protein
MTLLKSSVASLFLLTFFFITAGCNRFSRVDSRIFHVFSDFTFVGAGAYQAPPQPNGEDAHGVIEHGQNILSLPKRPVIGRQYIFHHKSPLDVQKLALADLPLRLQKEGLQIVKAPHSSREMMYLYFGGPLFVIKFKQGNHVGIIFNQPCPNFKDRVDKSWDANDYVVVFER